MNRRVPAKVNTQTRGRSILRNSTPHDPGHDSLTKIHEKQCVMSTGEVRDSLRDDLLDATACLYKLGADKACHRWSFMFKSSGTETTLCEFKFFRLETPLKVHGNLNVRRLIRRLLIGTSKSIFTSRTFSFLEKK